MATDKQVEAAVAKVEKLRREVADLNTEREVSEREALNETKLQQLSAEERQLNQELEYAKRLKAARAAASKKATDGVTDAAAPAAVGTTIQSGVNRLGETPTDAAPATDGKGK